MVSDKSRNTSQSSGSGRKPKPICPAAVEEELLQGIPNQRTAGQDGVVRAGMALHVADGKTATWN